jgi:hypothetical protein
VTLLVTSPPALSTAPSSNSRDVTRNSNTTYLVLYTGARVLSESMRVRGGCVFEENTMKYEIFPDGRVRADNPNDVLALWMKMKAPAEIEVSKPRCTQDSWSIFTKMLHEPWLTPHQHILATLKKQDGAIDRDAFRELLGPMFRSNNVVGGLIGGIGRYARRAGLDLETIIIREGRSYRPGPLLREWALPWEDAA